VQRQRSCDESNTTLHVCKILILCIIFANSEEFNFRTVSPCQRVKWEHFPRFHNLSVPVILQGAPTWTDGSFWDEKTFLASLGEVQVLKSSPKTAASNTNEESVSLRNFIEDLASQKEVVFDRKFLNTTSAAPLRKAVWLDVLVEQLMDGPVDHRLLSLAHAGTAAIAFHHHGPAFSASVRGSKTWLFLPPNSQAMQAYMWMEIGGVATPTVRDWLQPGGPQVFESFAETPVICEQHAFDIMFTSQGWWHPTLARTNVDGIVVVFPEGVRILERETPNEL